MKNENTIGKLLINNRNINPNKFNKNGISQLTCQYGNRKYIGQRGRPFHIRFQEDFHEYKHGNGKSKFAQHLLDNKHSIGTMEDIMEVLHIKSKVGMINNLERIPYRMKLSSTIKLMTCAQ